MIESPFSKTMSKTPNANWGAEAFLTAQSGKEEIQAALKSCGVFLGPVETKNFIPAFKRAAENILRKQPQKDKIPPALAAEWARKCANKKRKPRQKIDRPDPIEAQREDNRHYWTNFLRQRQGRNEI